MSRSAVFAYRAAAGLGFFFFVGHTVGVLGGDAPGDAQAALQASMAATPLVPGGSRSTFDAWFGLNLYLSVFLLLLTAVAVSLSRRGSEARAGLGVALAGSWAAVAGISWRYFFLAPAAVASLAAIAALVALLQARRGAPGE